MRAMRLKPKNKSAAQWLSTSLRWSTDFECRFRNRNNMVNNTRIKQPDGYQLKPVSGLGVPLCQRDIIKRED
jgi:hypothetical protein